MRLIEYIALVEGEQRQSPILVLVHPGSACGSADFNLGAKRAKRARAKLAAEVLGWSGGLLIADGTLSEEIRGFPEYRSAIQSGLLRAKASGGLSARVFACAEETPNWPQTIVESLTDARVDATTPLVVSGAWLHLDDEHGCVNTTAAALKRAGFRHVEISKNSVVLP